MFDILHDESSYRKLIGIEGINRKHINNKKLNIKNIRKLQNNA